MGLRRKSVPTGFEVIIFSVMVFECNKQWEARPHFVDSEKNVLLCVGEELIQSGFENVS